MEIWLKGTNKVRIPVLPSEYTVSSGQNNTIVNVIGLGDVVLKGKRGLRSISFSSFFPMKHDLSYCEYTSIKSPKAYVELIEKMKRAGAIKLIITGTQINFRCTIESFEWGENDGTGDINYTLSLQEYRTPATSTSSVVQVSSDTAQSGAASATGETRTEQTAATGTYTVKKGDCLTSIAKTQLGTSNWKALYEQNKAIIGSNPNLIQIGMVLTLPGA